MVIHIIQKKYNENEVPEEERLDHSFVPTGVRSLSLGAVTGQLWTRLKIWFSDQAVCWLDVELKEIKSILDRNLNPSLQLSVLMLYH